MMKSEEKALVISQGNAGFYPGKNLGISFGIIIPKTESFVNSKVLTGSVCPPLTTRTPKQTEQTEQTEQTKPFGVSSVSGGKKRGVNYNNYKQLNDAWGRLLSDFPWDWFLTVTFKGWVGLWGAEMKWRALIRFIREETGHRFEWVRVTEWHKFRNVPHYHALLLNCKGVNALRVINWWWGSGRGRARMYRYNKSLGAGFYLGKYLGKELSDITFSRGLRYFQQVEPDDPQGLSLKSLLS